MNKFLKDILENSYRNPNRPIFKKTILLSVPYEGVIVHKDNVDDLIDDGKCNAIVCSNYVYTNDKRLLTPEEYTDRKKK